MHNTEEKLNQDDRSDLAIELRAVLKPHLEGSEDLNRLWNHCLAILGKRTQKNMATAND